MNFYFTPWEWSVRILTGCFSKNWGSSSNMSSELSGLICTCPTTRIYAQCRTVIERTYFHSWFLRTLLNFTVLTVQKYDTSLHYCIYLQFYYISTPGSSVVIGESIAQWVGLFMVHIETILMGLEILSTFELVQEAFHCSRMHTECLHKVFSQEMNQLILNDFTVFVSFFFIVDFRCLDVCKMRPEEKS